MDDGNLIRTAKVKKFIEASSDCDVKVQKNTQSAHWEIIAKKTELSPPALHCFGWQVYLGNWMDVNFRIDTFRIVCEAMELKLPLEVAAH